MNERIKNDYLAKKREKEFPPMVALLKRTPTTDNPTSCEYTEIISYGVLQGLRW